MKVLVSVFGSAGDLFPLVPVVQSLEAEGCEVRCAVPRSLGLYLRSRGIASVGLGDGSELGVMTDPRIFTTRFDGWSSWRRTLAHYVAPTLEADVHQFDRLFAAWRPDVVVTSGFAVAARVAAARHELPSVGCSIYPQHEEADLRRAGRFARPLVRVVRQLAGDDADLARLAFGQPADLLLHDRALLEPGSSADRAVGFPYWDGVAGRPDDEARIEGWLARPGRHVLVTLGSFVGLAQREAWSHAADAVAELGVSGLLVGAHGGWADEVFGHRGDLCCVGFVPLAPVIGRFDAVVHHGGIGTTMGALRAARPAVVVPQAFDQSYNARLVERVGAGLDGSTRPLAGALAALLDDPEAARRRGRLAASLTSTEAATAATCRVIRDRAGVAA